MTSIRSAGTIIRLRQSDDNAKVVVFDVSIGEFRGNGRVGRTRVLASCPAIEKTRLMIPIMALLPSTALGLLPLFLNPNAKVGTCATRTL